MALHPRLNRVPAVLVFLAVLAVGCSSDASDILESQDTSTTSEVVVGVETSTTQLPSSTTVSSTAPTVDLPGESTDFGPLPGDTLAVVGVGFDDRLNVRTGPGTEFDVVIDLENRHEDVIATGQNRLLPQSIWFEVSVEGVTGWANGSFLGYLGLSRNGTGDFASWYGQDALPARASMGALGQLVTDSLKSEAPPSRITVTQPPENGVMIHDIVGLGDDSIAGLRVTTAAELTGEDDVTRRITRVDQQVICGRGVTPDGLCV